MIIYPLGDLRVFLFFDRTCQTRSFLVFAKKYFSFKILLWFGQQVHFHTKEENGHIRFLKDINKLSDFEKFEEEKLRRIEEEKKEQMKDLPRKKLLYPWLFDYEEMTKQIGNEQKEKNYLYLKFIKKGFKNPNYTCPEWDLPEDIKEGEEEDEDEEEEVDDEKVSLRPVSPVGLLLNYFFIFSGIQNGKKASSSINVTIIVVIIVIIRFSYH